MKLELPAEVTAESLFVWLISRISEVFRERAVLKGGMALRLLDMDRYTNDLDYTFVPFKSKKEIASGIEKILKELPGADITKTIHSTAIRYGIKFKSVTIQIEASVAVHCDSIPVSTISLSRDTGIPAKIIRVMSPPVALSNKISAWNERRLYRDLYDINFLYKRLGEKPCRKTLSNRLKKINSRLPELKNKRKMTFHELGEELKKEAFNITQKKVEKELLYIVREEEVAGLSLKLRAMLNELSELIFSFK